MHINDELEQKLLAQPFTEEADAWEECKQTALLYARMENAIAVLSDMRTNTSFICYGGLAERLGLGLKGTTFDIGSIWEEEIFSRIHPDHLEGKHLEELRFYHFVMSKPLQERTDYFLQSQLRMLDAEGNCLQVIHRMFYPAYDSNGCARLALCLYHLSPIPASAPHLIVNSMTGDTIEPEACPCDHLLSNRECEILRLIEQGYASKVIAASLFISINTVNRHRQNILQKLQATNSVEACRIAKNLKLI